MKIPPAHLLLRCGQEKAAFGIEFSRLGRNHSTAVCDPVSAEALNGAKPFKEIPGPKALPLIGNLHRYLPGIGEFTTSKWHEASKVKYKQFGSIVREEILPGINLVHLYDPIDMETVHRNEGRLPRRDFFMCMKSIRERNHEIYSSVGLAAGNGEDWLDLRRRSQKSMMRPQIMKTYLPQMNDISNDLIHRIRLLKQPNQQVPKFMNELFKWALESVTYILFNKRMGCLADNLSPDSMGQKYIQALNDFFNLTSTVELSQVPIWRIAPSLSPSFQKLKKVHDFFFENAMEYVKEQLAELEKGADPSDDESLMQLLLRSCSPRDACVVAVDSMAAGIDTTSLSLAYVLRNLAANPEAQKRLQEEVDRVLPNHKPLTVQAIDDMPYMRACIKESMRITPTVQGTSRTLDKDIVLSGYRVPAETTLLLNYYVSSLEEVYFPDATKYKPERWLRSTVGGGLHNFAFQPFGFGPRMCIGRRIADLEMLTLISKIMQNFWVENNSEELDINFQLVLMIKSPLQYEFHERKK